MNIDQNEDNIENSVDFQHTPIKVKCPDCGKYTALSYAEWKGVWGEKKPAVCANCGLTIESKFLYKLEQFRKKLLKSRKEHDIETSFHIDDNETFMLEQIYDGRETAFCRYDIISGKWTYVSRVERDEGAYVPIMGEELEKGAIILPSKVEEYGTDEELDKEIIQFIYKWLDVPDNTRQFMLWNIKRSWVYQRFHTLNYLSAMGDTGQGKTRYLNTTGYLHYKGLATSGATTSAPIFRMIEKWKGTLIMDEADLKFSDETADMIKIINLGYEKGTYIMRCDKNDPTKVDFFDPYCPKIIARRKPFADKATESRCFTTIMQGTQRDDIPPNLNPSFFSEAQHLRNKLLLWRFRNYTKINPESEIKLKIKDLEPRVRQITTSFYNLFSRDEKQMEIFENFIRKYQEDLIDERKNSREGEIVSAIYELLKKGIIDISASDIIEEGNLLDWKGNHLRPRSLSPIIKSLGFGKTLIKRVDEKVKRCLPLKKNHLENLFKRYGFPDFEKELPFFTKKGLKKIADFAETPEFGQCNDSRGIPISKTAETPEFGQCNVVTRVTGVYVTATSLKGRDNTDKEVKKGGSRSRKQRYNRIQSNNRYKIAQNQDSVGVDFKTKVDVFELAYEKLAKDSGKNEVLISDIQVSEGIIDEVLPVLLKKGDYFEPKSGYIAKTR